MIVRERYRVEVEGALRAALGERSRTLLRYNLIDGWNIERIGAIYGVHRATVARWIAQGRDSLLELVERELAKRLAVEVDEVGSIIRLVRSRIEVSLVRLLDEPGAPPSDDASDRRSTSCRLACSFARAGSAAAVLSDPSSWPSNR